jgi:hypothetical protein
MGHPDAIAPSDDDRRKSCSRTGIAVRRVPACRLRQPRRGGVTKITDLNAESIGFDWATGANPTRRYRFHSLPSGGSHTEARGNRYATRLAVCVV